GGSGGHVWLGGCWDVGSVPQITSDCGSVSWIPASAGMTVWGGGTGAASTLPSSRRRPGIYASTHAWDVDWRRRPNPQQGKFGSGIIYGSRYSAEAPTLVEQ